MENADLQSEKMAFIRDSLILLHHINFGKILLYWILQEKEIALLAVHM